MCKTVCKEKKYHHHLIYIPHPHKKEYKISQRVKYISKKVLHRTQRDNKLPKLYTLPFHDAMTMYKKPPRL
ncbi:MAG TPA: hypothetical protein DCE42_29475 [Myxococcales bacterium]|nr:hypothetical protein [Deltaproteobacteria bacterium]HAA58924.1 hypothetical protein [Myxococcales bacterium]